jgi:hypothetical protein
MNWSYLTKVDIVKCFELTSIPSGAAGWKALTHLTLRKCDKLEFISKEAIAAWTKLKHLTISKGHANLIRNIPTLLKIEYIDED